jgi:hypothetical protein
MNDNSTFTIDTADVSALHNILAHLSETGYSETIVREHLGLKDLSDIQMRALPIYRKERLNKRSPLDTTIDLFLLQGTIQAEELSRLLSTKDIEVLVRTGVLVIDKSGAILSTVSLYPVENHLFFSDHAWPQLSNAEIINIPSDQVMFVGADSHWLARATIRRPVSNALDLCTGSGIHALLAATHSQRVVAVDINPRAVRCTRFNAQITDCHNLEVVQGDLYEPVGAEKFDLITANPPFVPSPVDSLLFRDGGRSGEDIQRRIVAGLAEHLAPGGVAQIVTEIGESDENPLVDRVRQWLGGAPLDIHVLRLRIHSASVYAIGHGTGNTNEEFLESVDAWADNLRAQGFTRVISVLLAFQWSNPLDAKSWNRVDEAYPPLWNAGTEIEAAFAAERMTSEPGLRGRLEQGRLVRSGPVILNEARVIGSELPPTCLATLSGQALPVEYHLDPIEKDLLVTLNSAVEFLTLLKIAQQIDISETTLCQVLISLLRKRLIKLVGE